jgi:hypothetical protein
MKFLHAQPPGISARVRVLIASLLLTWGCGGPKLVQIRGRVLVDGIPAEGAQLLFHPNDPAGKIASGVADKDGAFTLVSDMDAGVMPGKYTVTVNWPDPAVKPTESQKMMGTFDGGPDLLKGKYVMKDKSGLSAEITASTKELPAFDLKRK